MFKVGDKITPVESDWLKEFPHWDGMVIIEYTDIQMEATVKTKDGDIIDEFNLDPNFGAPFKVIR